MPLRPQCCDVCCQQRVGAMSALLHARSRPLARRASGSGVAKVVPLTIEIFTEVNGAVGDLDLTSGCIAIMVGTAQLSVRNDKDKSLALSCSKGLGARFSHCKLCVWCGPQQLVLSGQLLRHASALPV